MSYTYVREMRRYRNNETGKFVNRKTVLAYVDEITFASDDKVAALKKQYDEGTISAKDFGAKMKTEIKKGHVAEACLGKGGRENMSKSDWGVVGRTLRKQYKYMDGFVKDLEAGRYEPGSGAIEVRAQMYMRAVRQSYEKAYAASWGVRNLPAYAGDGQSPCRTSCRCGWTFTVLGDETHAKWNAVSDKVICPVCRTRAEVWNPLIYKEGKLTNPELLKAKGVFNK